MFKSTGVIRKIDELGRVVLPIETRMALGIEEKDRLEILLDMENEQLVLRKTTKLCMKCKSPENLKEIKPGFYLCSCCIEALQ